MELDNALTKRGINSLVELKRADIKNMEKAVVNASFQCLRSLAK